MVGRVAGFGDELLGGRAIGGDHAAQRADIANVANQRARIDIPDDRNFVAIEIELRGFGGAPVGSRSAENSRTISDSM